MSLSWADAFKVAVAVVVLQTLVEFAVGGAGLALANPLVGVALVVGLGGVAAFAAYRSYRDTAPHTRER